MGAGSLASTVFIGKTGTTIASETRALIAARPRRTVLLIMAYSPPLAGKLLVRSFGDRVV